MKAKLAADLLRKSDRLLITLLSLAGFFCVTLAVHIAAILALPLVSENKGMTHWAAFATPGHPGLPPQTNAPQTGLPFEDPALVRGVCLYDLAENPFQLRAEIKEDGFFSFSFHQPSGEVFYAVTDRVAQHGRITLLLLNQKQFDAEDDEEDESDSSASENEELRIIAPSQKGFVLINALVPFPSQREKITNWMRSVECLKRDETTARESKFDDAKVNKANMMER